MFSNRIESRYEGESVSCDEAESTYINMSNVNTKKYMILGLAEWQPNNGEPFAVTSVFGVVDSFDNSIKYMSMILEDDSRFDLVGEMCGYCCETYGYHSALPSEGDRTMWEEVTCDNTILYSAETAMDDNKATSIYVCLVVNIGGDDEDSSIVVFTDNPTIPLFAFYNRHNGYYSHTVKWSFTDTNGEELAIGSKSI